MKRTEQIENLRKVVGLVAEWKKVPSDILLSKTKKGEVVILRQAIMYCMRTKLRLPYASIGGSLGKDHTTVLHTMNKVADEVYILETTGKKGKILSEVDEISPLFVQEEHLPDMCVKCEHRIRKAYDEMKRVPPPMSDRLVINNKSYKLIETEYSKFCIFTPSTEDLSDIAWKRAEKDGQIEWIGHSVAIKGNYYALKPIYDYGEDSRQ